MNSVAILQSNYIPWKGYFDIINSVDLFIFHDDLQYTKQDWRNRNKIKTPIGPIWLTIPCGTDENRLICEVELKTHDWQKKHWNQIVANYSKARYFQKYKAFFEKIYLSKVWTNLSDMNQHIIRSISSDLLKIGTKFDDSRKFDLQTTKADRVVELLRKVKATSYLSGPAAKSYLREDDLKLYNIDLKWMNYDGYKQYGQLYPPFDHYVSILDLLFNVGPEFKEYMLSFNS